MIACDPNLEIRLARDEVDRRAAQRLRYQVFVDELGGNGPLVDHNDNLEIDHFDPFADQLVLIDKRRSVEDLDHVVGLYRMLNDAGSRKAGQYYSETEFDLNVLHESGSNLLELGRSCLHKDYRGGSAMFMLWNGLSEYVRQKQIEILFGVASFFGTDVTVYAAHLSYLDHHHRTPSDLLVTARPKNYLSMDFVRPEEIDRKMVMQTMPSLIKAYLRIGGCVGDGAYVDDTFNTTDVCMVLDARQMKHRQRRLYGSGDQHA